MEINRDFIAEWDVENGTGKPMPGRQQNNWTIANVTWGANLTTLRKIVGFLRGISDQGATPTSHSYSPPEKPSASCTSNLSALVLTGSKFTLTGSLLRIE